MIDLLSVLVFVVQLSFSQESSLNNVVISELPADLLKCQKLEVLDKYSADIANVDFRIMFVLNHLSEDEIMNKETLRYRESTYSYATKIEANYVYHSMPKVSSMEFIPREFEHLIFTVKHGEDFIMLPPVLYSCDESK